MYLEDIIYLEFVSYLNYTPPVREPLNINPSTPTLMEIKSRNSTSPKAVKLKDAENSSEIPKALKELINLWRKPQLYCISAPTYTGYPIIGTRVLKMLFLLLSFLSEGWKGFPLNVNAFD